MRSAHSTSEAASSVFEALRWAEAQSTHGARCVLLPNLAASAGAVIGVEHSASEHEPALADRLYRAASGREAIIADCGQKVQVVNVGT